MEQIKPIVGVEEAEAVKTYLMSGGWLTEHSYTEKFEKDISGYLSSGYCSVVPNGTLGLILALKAVGVGYRDKVAVPALTMIATANAVRFLGAQPIFTDVDIFGCMDIKTLKERVRAVVYVSLNGSSSGLCEVQNYCDQNGIPLIEDACQSLGSKQKDKYLGTYGDIGVFSFSPHKIITTGQGGSIVTNNNLYYEEIEKLKDFGRLINGVDSFPDFGINAKFTDIQSIIGIEQLKTIDGRLLQKKQIYNWYKKYNSDILGLYDNENVPWFIGLRTKNNDKIQNKLLEYNINTRKMFPVIPNEPCYGDYRKFPSAEELSNTILWLPSSLDLIEKDVEWICSLI